MGERLPSTVSVGVPCPPPDSAAPAPHRAPIGGRTDQPYRSTRAPNAVPEAQGAIDRARLVGQSGVTTTSAIRAMVTRSALIAELTTETATLHRPVDEVLHYLADFSNLAAWDPAFESSRRVDDGPIGVGTRFEATASMAGSEFPMELEIVEYEEPNHVVWKGTGEGLTTTEDNRVEPTPEGETEVTYVSSYETDKPDLIDAAGKPGFFMIGKAAIRGMNDTLGR